MQNTNDHPRPIDRLEVKSGICRRIHRGGGCLFAILCFLLCACECEAGLKIYYIRHAEAGHNVAREWAVVPKEQWPAFVGNPDMFTPKGVMQQAAVAGKLKRYHFDFIAVSPIWRCRNTVMPYLKETGAKGEIWPELGELYATSLIVSPDLPPSPPANEILGAGPLVNLPPEEVPFFSMRKDGTNNFKLPRFPKDHSDKERENAASRVVVQRVLDLIQERFGGTDKTILLVGHGSSGAAVLRMLTKDSLVGFPGITNTGIWMVEEQANGEFKLKMFNDVPLENGKAISARGGSSIATPNNQTHE